MLLNVRRLVKLSKFIANHLRFRGVYRKYRNFSMITEEPYVANLHLAAQMQQVAGCVVECGTWRGGMIAGIADVLGNSRQYYLFDSYEGLPPARDVDGAAALSWQARTTHNCAASQEEARMAMSMSVAKRYTITKGWFNETLPVAKIAEPIALLRMDADWYDSTMCILENLADRVVEGGIIIVDDYYTWDGCTQAVNEFAGRRRWHIRQFPLCGICYIEIEKPGIPH